MSERNEITFVIDGVEVRAPEGMMLVDAAKQGDIEIPVFCYEPKLGPPVGACRMCLVEIEGIPKLQTACSTPVRDGMVVYTQTERVKQAQNAVVEFLLVNHPLDCPVCDKGGECPLQDIAMGWGPGRSRVTDPKRHFRKPVPLSPLVRIDRERCILCYRCVRFSQEVSEDEQLQLLERGPRSYVGTFDDRPYIAPFHGNIIELCPVGALTSEAYRFRARPWDIEEAGTVCTLCPSQCNVKFTVRDERVMRTLARDNKDVDDGWLCDKGRFGFQVIHAEDRITEPQIGGGGTLSPATWAQALERTAEALRKAGPRTAVLIGSQASNEEGYLLQRIARQALGSPHIDSRGGHPIDRDTLLELSRPELGAAVADIDRAESVLLVGADPLNDMPILDLRLRKAIRRHGTRLVVATERPTTLDGGAEETARYAPGEAAAFLADLAAELRPGDGASGPYAEDAARIAGELRPGSTVIIFGERLGHGPNGDAALSLVLECAKALEASADGAGLLEVPERTNARGLREVGCLPVAGPGLAETDPGMGADEIREALRNRELEALILWDIDPLRELPDPEGWREALSAARFVLQVGAFATPGTNPNVFLPLETHAEKEGTVTHPDGRLQRLRPSIPHPGATRHGWQWLAELSALLGHETGIDSAPEALAAIGEHVPIYAGLTHEEIGGLGLRWQEREAARNLPEPAASAGMTAVATAPSPAPADGRLRLATYRDLWVAEATEQSPALRFLLPKQRLELAPADAERLGVAQGDEVELSANGSSIRARVVVRERMLPGAGFVVEGIRDANPAELGAPGEVEVEVARVEPEAPELEVIAAGGGR